MIDQAGIMMAQGKTIACERIQGVNDNMAKSHFHDYFEMYYLEAGERYFVVTDQLYDIHPGEFILFPPYVMHHAFGKKDVPFKRLLLCFQKEEINSIELLKTLEQGAGLYRPEPSIGRAIHHSMEELLEEQENPSEFHDEYMLTILSLILLTVVKKSGRQPFVKSEKKNLIADVISYIHLHYQEDISLGHLTKVFYVSPYYLCRIFKKYTNRTIVQYINITRIMNAQRMIMETYNNITKISQETGFSNVVHFNRVFKNITGMSPSDYRKMCKLLPRK